MGGFLKCRDRGGENFKTILLFMLKRIIQHTRKYAYSKFSLFYCHFYKQNVDSYGAIRKWVGVLTSVLKLLKIRSLKEETVAKHDRRGPDALVPPAGR